MALSLGIVGLPNVGKSTLFNALTRSKQANAQNYPFCTIDPNVGVVEVPDARLQELSRVSNSAKIIPTAIEFVDIAGLVQGASEGQGLGNKFLAHIREVDAIVQVVRAFADDNVIHVHNAVNPTHDADVINLELILADLQTVTKRLDTVKKNAKGSAAKDAAVEIAVLERLLEALQNSKPARSVEVTDDEQSIVHQLQLLTRKPMMYVVNVDEPGKIASVPKMSDALQVEVCAKLEAELAELSLEEAKEYMKSLGMQESGLDKIIVAGYTLLNLLTYFTSGPEETRAWTVKKGTLAPDAAGVIHTDFVKGFVKADVTAWEAFVEHHGWSGVRPSGKLQLVGRDYVVKDGDVCYFHIAS